MTPPCSSATMTSPRISVIVVTYNEEKQIERCLRSVTDWADEIIVLDSYSRDRTLELAQKYTEKVFQFEYPGYSKQVERGIDRAGSEWIFILDADEEVSAELASAIQAEIRDPAAKDGYSLNRKVRAFGKWIEHCGWFPDWQFRLFRKDAYVAEHQEVHGAFTTRGSKGFLAGLLYHYTYPTISSYLEKMNDYTSLHVSNKLKENPGMNIHWHKIVLSPLSEFLKMFLVKKGYKDGMQGFLLSVFSSMYTLALYAKVWEYRHRQKEGKGILPPITNVELSQLRSKYS